MRNQSAPQRDPRAPSVGAIDRSVAILDAIASGANRFVDIRAATGLAKATTHRLLGSLATHGFVVHDDAAGYRLGPALLRLAASARRDVPLRAIAHPVLERLSSETGESAQLYVRSGDARICVDAVESQHELRTIVPVGAALPLWAGSAAKVILAHAGDADRFLRQTSERARFERDVAAVRSRGWASSADERQIGVGSVSAPVLAPDGGLVAVVSVSGPSSRLSRAASRRYAGAVVEAARSMEAALGGGPA